MGMIVNPFEFGTPAGTFLLGNNAPATTSTAIAGDFQLGSGFLAALSGIANSIVIVGSGANNPALSYRLCVYGATNTTVWSGSLLGKTADITGLGVNEVKSIPLIVPVSIMSGQFYALTLHSSSAASGGTASNGVVGDRFFGDTFSDGPLATAGASGSNSPNGRLIYLTT